MRTISNFSQAGPSSAAVLDETFDFDMAVEEGPRVPDDQDFDDIGPYPSRVSPLHDREEAEGESEIEVTEDEESDDGEGMGAVVFEEIDEDGIPRPPAGLALEDGEEDVRDNDDEDEAIEDAGQPVVDNGFEGERFNFGLDDDLNLDSGKFLFFFLFGYFLVLLCCTPLYNCGTA